MLAVQNNFGLPDIFVKAIYEEPYDMFRATSIIKPPTLNILWGRHSNEVTYDITELLPAMLGIAFHKYAKELATKFGEIVRLSEETVSMGFGELGSINGTPDLVVREGDKLVLWDYKVSQKRSRLKDEWVKQLNIYALLLEQVGIKVDEARLLKINKDFYGSDKNTQSIYGTFTPFDRYDVPTDKKATRVFIESRLQKLIDLHDCSDDELPPCPPSDTWGGKRCRYYCKMVQWCPYGRRLLDESSGISNNQDSV